MRKGGQLFKRDQPVGSQGHVKISMGIAACLVAMTLTGAWLWSNDALPFSLPHLNGKVSSNIPVSISKQLGIEALAKQLASEADKTMPTGKGIVTGHVESKQTLAYLPAVTASRFKGVTFHPRSGPSKPSGHASATATIIYGPKGLAPGISQVECFATSHWLGNGFLNAYSDQEPLNASPIRLFTCSWVSYDFHPASDILLRIDQVVEEQGVVVVAGVNNGSNTGVPPVLASAYNIIAVGDWDGESSHGYTTDDTAGRSKPDLVAPGGLTSFATPGVGAMAARLMETADQMGLPRVGQPLIIKAVLMAGADKPKDWLREPGKPLDDRYGAGRPRLDHSYEMLTHPLTPNQLPLNSGWDKRAIEPGQDMTYRLLLEQPIASFSAVLTWHRKVESRLATLTMGRKLRRQYRGRMAYMTLSLVRSDLPEYQTLDESLSEIDNVQHVYATKLPAGRYDLVIRRPDGLDETWDYVLAWRVAYEADDSGDSDDYSLALSFAPSFAP